MRRAAVLGLLAAVVLAAGATLRDGTPSGTVGRGRALHSPTVKEGVTNTYTMAIRTGVVAIATMEYFGVDADATLESTEPLSVSPGLEILAVRVNYVVRRGVHSFRGFPGVFCTDRWPPRRFLDLRTPANLPLRVGDSIAVTVFARAKTEGDYHIKGVRVRYRQGGHAMEQTTESTTLTVLARSDEAHLRPTAKCPPDVPSHWLDEVSTLPDDAHPTDESHDH